MGFHQTFKALSDPTRRAILERLKNGRLICAICSKTLKRAKKIPISLILLPKAVGSALPKSALRAICKT